MKTLPPPALVTELAKQLNCGLGPCIYNDRKNWQELTQYLDAANLDRGVVVVLSAGQLSAQMYAEKRKAILERHILRAVVKMPDKLFGTSANTYLLWFNNEPCSIEPNRISMVDFDYKDKDPREFTDNALAWNLQLACRDPWSVPGAWMVPIEVIISNSAFLEPKQYLEYKADYGG